MLSSSGSFEEQVYQGQFGEYRLDRGDRLGVQIYRGGLLVAASSLAIATGLVLGQTVPNDQILNILWWFFAVALGISLWTIHIYLAPLHRLLQGFWAIGCFSALLIGIYSPEPLVSYIFHHPLTLLGVGFTFAALTGIYFKEAFCFNRLETKVLTFLVPLLCIGHLLSIFPVVWSKYLLVTWSILFGIFAVRKLLQPIPDDIGDKSVFIHLQQKTDL